ncbi:MAG: phosphoadenylyl-sulfate reductase [Actinomycetota bacterium]
MPTRAVHLHSSARRGPRLTLDEVRSAAGQLEQADAADVVAWARSTFGDRLCVATSFTDTVLVHLATRVDPDLRVVFLDTGFHFAETLATMKQAQARYQLNLEVVRPEPSALDVWQAGSEACCRARKIDGLDRALGGRTAAWLSGLRRADGPSRADTPVVDLDGRGLVKINPLARWSDAEVADYERANDLVTNPLVAQGYPSVGCWPCTEPASADNPRAGRWSGTAKTECGLHQ